ncbi:electron transfer flavoprotein-ubiquinone oxidoreductase [[Pseudomonas] carboxydohydrogena]|uniref:Electron transfer flavoprotein-ubiquinone oxidoreductase n=1 Tax=Afipia carboxydohydrogena TaxID=290 RepID=A0ABY8BLD9_AFICR|nr:electron transfer flavoprotein-ubiquinone oxidoreductase [[Pseudomonas] carboxydohydrogena]WEF50810.1 electron transfer flavoprotein-ubiquinone oxidoreductase [[Pseudomonas] carboxydohydrogena]
MNDEPQPRDSMEFDVVIVGAGPAGLSAAIRLKQIEPALSVVVIEKGSEVGAHILSGAVIDPAGLDDLIPEWRDEDDCPLKTRVSEDRFAWMTAGGEIRLPNILMPPLMNNHHCYIGSLGDLCRWLGTRAEALGVEIYPGFAATEIVYGEHNEVRGVATGDMGVARDGSHKASFTRGMELLGKYTLFAEGARGSLTRQLIARYALDSSSEPPKFGIGLKEVWQIDKAKHRPGLVRHSFGWPLGNKTGGGSFLYHYGENLAAIGFVVHLNYDDPYLSPFEEFQRFKTHPSIRPTLEGGKRLSYGARAITEGGFQSVPRLTFAGGALIGCAAGFVNVPRIKGVHNAMRSGMIAAEHVTDALAEGRANDELVQYESGWRLSSVGRDLNRVRNVKPLWSKFGTVLGVMLGGLDMWMQTLLGLSLFGTLSHGKTDAASLHPAGDYKPRAACKPDGQVTFDRLSSVFLSNTNHEEDQPVHLKVLNMALQKSSEHDVFAGPSNRYCPAGVYEWLDETDGPRFQINAQNCVHCKTCDIKDPNANIVWVPPEGGGGPNYQGM